MKDTLTKEERQDIINSLVRDYEYYINDSDDEELQEIYESGCFTVGSLKYYKEKGI